METGQKITREEAIKKLGLTALAASSLLFLNTPASAKNSGQVKGNNGHGNGDQFAPGNSDNQNNAENSEHSGQGNSGKG